MDRIPRNADDAKEKVKDNYDDTAKTKVKVFAEKVWYDDGYRSAMKGEVITVSDDDLHMLSETGQVAKLGQEPKPQPKPSDPKPVKDPNAPNQPGKPSAHEQHEAMHRSGTQTVQRGGDQG